MKQTRIVVIVFFINFKHFIMDNNVLTQPVQEEQINPKVVENTSEEQSTVFSENHSSFTKKELLEELENSINEKSIEELKLITESIKIAFYKRNKQDFDIAKQAYLANGGIETEFKLEPDSYEERLKELMFTYREKRNAINAEIEKQKSENLQIKKNLIIKLKELVALSETDNENTYSEFIEIQKQWREIGVIPKESLNTTWNDYHFQVECYYNIMKINKELRDLDLKRNLEHKIILCEEAEKLSLSSSFVESFRQLQLLHDKWREIGPVSNEHKNEVWDRFKQASTIINKNHQQYFENLNEEQERNLNIKTELCSKVEDILSVNAVTKKDWDSQTEEIIKIQNIWKTIGFAPKKDNSKIYEQFRDLCNSFFERKHSYFKALKSKFENNLQIKTEICKQAQLLKNSSDWQSSTNEFIKLQKQWKETGAVPSKESDTIWNDFRAACDFFFDRKNEYYKQQEDGFADKITAKESIIEELKSFTEENPHTAIEKLKEIQRRWSESGFLPARIQNPLYLKYKEIIDSLFTTFKKGLTQLNMDNFKNKVSTSSSKSDISREKEHLQRKLQKLETDINTLENNIGFFAMSSNASSLIKDIENKISQTREEIIFTKEKIKHINKEEKNRIEQ